MAEIALVGASILVPSAVGRGVCHDGRCRGRPSRDAPRDGDGWNDVKPVYCIGDVVAVDSESTRAEAGFNVVGNGGRLLETSPTKRTVEVACTVYTR